jgi:proline dehydrogenase
MADVKTPAERWTLPDLPAAIAWCRRRNTEGIRCILDVLGESSVDPSRIRQTIAAYRACIDAVQDAGVGASITLKLTAIGVTGDPAGARSVTLDLARRCVTAGIGFEIDMEARGLVDATLDIAFACLQEHCPVTVALQAYLRRTPADMHALLAAGGRPRLVKGAYFGDSDDFSTVAAWLRDLAETALAAGKGFSLATHDPALIGWITQAHADARARIELSFLKGLADTTKPSLVRAGWTVTEYVPYGTHATPYIARRERYLRDLARLDLHPVP